MKVSELWEICFAYNDHANNETPRSKKEKAWKLLEKFESFLEEAERQPVPFVNVCIENDNYKLGEREKL